MIRSALRSLVRDYLQESSTTPFSDALINDMLNQGQARLAEIAEYAPGKFEITGGFVLNRHDVLLPDRLLTIYAVAAENADGDIVPMEGPLSVQEMDDRFSDWRNDDADQPERWWLMANALWVHPKPDADAATDTLEILGTKIPEDMDADGDTPEDLVPTSFHRALAKYAAWKILAMDKENPTAARMAGFWQAEFMDDAQRLRRIVQGRSNVDGEGLRIQRSRDTTASIALIDTDDD